MVLNGGCTYIQSLMVNHQLLYDYHQKGHMSCPNIHFADWKRWFK